MKQQSCSEVKLMMLIFLSALMRYNDWYIVIILNTKYQIIITFKKHLSNQRVYDTHACSYKRYCIV